MSPQQAGGQASLVAASLKDSQDTKKSKFFLNNSK